MLTNYFRPNIDLEHIRLMEEAVQRAQALGRPFTEEEVFQSAWEQGVEVYPAQDTRFAVHQEYPRLWVLTDTPQEYASVPASTVTRWISAKRPGKVRF